jgi:hypothetical protein
LNGLMPTGSVSSLKSGTVWGTTVIVAVLLGRKTVPRTRTWPFPNLVVELEVLPGEVRDRRRGARQGVADDVAQGRVWVLSVHLLRDRVDQRLEAGDRLQRPLSP